LAWLVGASALLVSTHLTGCHAEPPAKPVTTDAQALAIAKPWFDDEGVPPEALRVKRNADVWEVAGPSPSKKVFIDAKTGVVSADVVVEGYIKPVGVAPPR
jgi:hypothetical protein